MLKKNGLVGEGRQGRDPRAAGPPPRRSSPARSDAAMTYEPYLSSRARQARRGQDHRHDARLPDGDGHLRLHAEVHRRSNPKVVQAMVDSYFEALADDQAGPEEELRDHGRRWSSRRGEQFEKSQSYLRWQDREANKKFFAGEHAGVQQGGGRPAARARHHQAACPTSPSLVDTQLHQVRRRARRGRAAGAAMLTPLVPVSPRREGRARRRLLRRCSSCSGAAATLRRLRAQDLPRRSRDDAASRAGGCSPCTASTRTSASRSGA